MPAPGWVGSVGLVLSLIHETEITVSSHCCSDGASPVESRPDRRLTGSDTPSQNSPEYSSGTVNLGFLPTSCCSVLKRQRHVSPLLGVGYSFWGCRLEGRGDDRRGRGKPPFLPIPGSTQLPSQEEKKEQVPETGFERHLYKFLLPHETLGIHSI